MDSKGKGKETLSRAAKARAITQKLPFHPMRTRASSSVTATDPAPAIHTPTGQTPATMADIKVWYILVNHNLMPFGEPVRVNLGYDEDVLQLKMEIKKWEDKENNNHVNIADMEVWKCHSLTLRHVEPDSVAGLIHNMTFSSDADSHARKLGGWVQVKDLQLQDFEPLVVIVRHKAAKRKQEDDDDDDDDYLEGARLCKLARLEPSKANDPSIYELLQESQQERILDDCPNPDTDIPPLPLLYWGFGEFHDAVENPTDDLVGTDLMDEVDQLADATCKLGYEKGKRLNAQDHLRRIFSVGIPREFSYVVGNGSTTDGYLLARHGGPLLVVEYKRQIAMAEPQLASYFLRLALKPLESIFRQWRQPGLGLLIRGTYISFHGLVMIDKQVRVLPLTPAFPCNDSELYNRMPLYAAFGAARRLLVRIERDAESLVGLPSPSPAIPGSQRRYPNVGSLLRVSGNNEQAGERVHFQITERLRTGLGGKRLLFLASTIGPDPKVIVIKFSRQYGRDFHVFCASLGHAPELLAFERLPGGWFGIAMEYLPSAGRILESGNLSDYGERWLQEIVDIVSQFHAQGYVHGDLRPPNFIVNGERLLLIDFDWGGKETEATFPRARLDPILRDSRLEMQITKEHDERVMQYTRGLLREALEKQLSRGARS